MNSEKYQIGQRIEIHSQFRFAAGRSKSLIETNFVKCFKNGKIYEGRKFNKCDKNATSNEKSFGIASLGTTAQKMVFDEMKILSSLSDSRLVFSAKMPDVGIRASNWCINIGRGLSHI